MEVLIKRYITREQRIEQIKACGQAIIDNAEQIYGNYEYPQNLTVTVTICSNEAPALTYERSFMTDGILKSININ